MAGGFRRIETRFLTPKSIRAASVMYRSTAGSGEIIAFARDVRRPISALPTGIAESFSGVLLK